MPPTEGRLWTTERELCRRQGNLCEPALCNSRTSKGPLWPRLSFTVFYPSLNSLRALQKTAKRLVAICRSSNSFLLVFAYPVSNVPICPSQTWTTDHSTSLPKVVPFRETCSFLPRLLPERWRRRSVLWRDDIGWATRPVRAATSITSRAAISACSVQLQCLSESPARRRC